MSLKQANRTERSDDTMPSRGIRIVLLAAALAAFAGPSTGAAESDSLTLGEAVDTALANSRLLKAADADLRAAEAGAAAARGGRLPVVELTEDVLRTTNPSLVFGSKLGQERFAASDFELDNLNEPDAFTNYQTRLSVRQPLWTGGRLKHGIRAAELGVDSSASGRERTRQEVVGQTVDAYVGALVAAQRLAVAEQVRETVRAHLKLVRDLYDAGLVVESDVLQLEVRESEVEEMVIRARAAATVSQAALAVAMGVEQGTQFRLDERITPVRPDIEGRTPAGPEALIAQALAERPDLVALEAAVAVAGEQASAARAELRPGVAAGGFYEINGEDLTSADGDNWGVTLGLRWTAFDGYSRRSRARQAEEGRNAAKERAALFREQVALEVRRAFHEAEAAAGRLEQGSRAVTAAERGLIIVEDRYREGLATLVELQEAETSLAEARSRRVEAEGDLLRARTALDLAVGRL